VQGKDRSENYLFKELMPFGGHLEAGNRWLKIKGLIPWGELEAEYASYFSDKGRLGPKFVKALEDKTYRV
jgi:hypothetical protein